VNQPPRPSKICATCRSPLETFIDQETKAVTYQHGGAIHCDNVDPIDYDGGPLIEHCDFCLAPNPTWSFPAKLVRDPNMLFAMSPDGSLAQDRPSNQYVSPDEWAACGDCKPLVEGRDWRGLWSRNRHVQEVRAKAPENFHTARLVCLNLWLEFDRQRDGEPYRYDPNDPNGFADAVKSLLREEGP
jgi:hypothetical protein